MDYIILFLTGLTNVNTSMYTTFVSMLLMKSIIWFFFVLICKVECQHT